MNSSQTNIPQNILSNLKVLQKLISRNVNYITYFFGEENTNDTEGLKTTTKDIRTPTIRSTQTSFSIGKPGAPANSGPGAINCSKSDGGRGLSLSLVSEKRGVTIMNPINNRIEIRFNIFGIK